MSKQEEQESEKAKTLTQLVLYIIPAVILVLVSVIPWLYNARKVAQVGAVCLIIFGIVVVGASIRKNIVIRSSPALGGWVGRRELYGTVAVLFGWFQLWIMQFDSEMDGLSSRIDGLSSRIDGLSSRIDQLILQSFE